MGEKWAKSVTIAGLVLVAVLIGSALGWLRRPRPSGPLDTARVQVTSETYVLEVHVAGWVNDPGVVLVPAGSIVADALAAAGGMKPGARVDSINLAAPVSGGEQLMVPGPADRVAGDEPAGASGDLISINQATAPELETLPGVGPVLAERIVAHRDSAGRFDSVEDLLEVPGIGEAKLAALRDLVRP